MTLISLQSKDHRGLLDIIDRLRSRGFSRYVDLPEIIVCGDQSSGKSSVLEAISGISFPAKDGLCTRFATELCLRRDSKIGVEVKIHPSKDRDEAEKERLHAFHHEVDIAKPDLGDVIEKAKLAMGLSEGKIFSNDILRIELCGPAQPHLTVVDLPGLFRAGNSEQSTNDAKIVQRLVRGYMERKRSIILAVVSAKSEIVLQDVYELALEMDPKRTRTIGLITKPDTLSEASPSEASYLKLARNEEVKLQLGWHVLKNRSYETRNATSAERDEDEKEFFRTSAWATLDPSQVGVESLRARLSTVLKDQILRQLPDLSQEVESEITRCHRTLKQLGGPWDLGGNAPVSLQGWTRFFRAN